MRRQNSATFFKEAIQQLESKQAIEGKLLRVEVQIAYERIKPINLIKNTFKDIIESQELKNNFLSAGAGLTAGYFSKALFEKASHNPLKKLVGTAMLFGITNLVAKHPETVRSVGLGLLRVIRQKIAERASRPLNTLE